MDVFKFNQNLIKDYCEYIKSFINVRDPKINDEIEQYFDDEAQLWPEPLIQLNPSFENGESIDELCDQGILHEKCKDVFRKDKKGHDDYGNPLRLYKHQAEAIRAANGGKNYVLTTGTGSGKSLAYIVPIVDHVLKQGSGKGIQAIVVYPMNALANSQYGELEKFLCNGFPSGKGPVTFERYTGQENEEKKQEIIANPPDILLTNYVMLELILTRTHDRKLIHSARNLRYIVLDELHTYRGRQGADVSLLIRRVRDLCNGDTLQCVGTSATLAGEGTYEEKQKDVAQVATKLFGAEVRPEGVIGETVKRITPDVNVNEAAFADRLRKRIENPGAIPATSFTDFIEDPLAIWVETVFGVSKDSAGRLVRAIPRSLTGKHGAVKELSDKTNLPEHICVEAVKKCLLAGYNCYDPATGFPVFAFRLHQFISKGDTVYASLEEPERRFITMEGQKFVPGDRSRLLFPLLFCRECGQEYYFASVSKDAQSGTREIAPRGLDERYEENDGDSAYLYVNPSNPWPSDYEEEIKRLPDDFLDSEGRIKKSRQPWRPEKIILSSAGVEDSSGLVAYLVSAPFRFCLNCGVAYSARRRSDFAKLATLGTEGRSTATTILCLSAIVNLKKDQSLEKKARKLLSFTDNRQDASLQAGHFNDFVEVGLLRAALYNAALEAGQDGLSHEDLTQRVFDKLDIPLGIYAVDPAVKYRALDETKRALRNVIGYRLYHDLRRGWRIMMPNLEQCGLLEIEYQSLEELCENQSDWQDCHPALSGATPENRKQVAKELLNFMRRQLAIKVDYLDKDYQERIQQLSSQHLLPPWSVDEKSEMEHSAILFPRASSKEDFGGNVYLSERGAFGQYLRRYNTFKNHKEQIDLEQTSAIVKDLLSRLRLAGLVEVVEDSKSEDGVEGYQIPASAMRWVARDGKKGIVDRLRVISESVEGSATNKFFVQFYKNLAFEAKTIKAHEHTAQVPYGLRVEREDLFREGDLPILYCSPTMELGVDIAQLNAVNMRNIPPTPANYAQRSGRAGRSGQPALVFSYCSTGNSHDQYFFRRPELMVSGAVTPPRLDLANEELVKSHVHAIWLAETNVSLGRSLKDILDVAGERPSLEVLPSVRDSLALPAAWERANVRAGRVLGSIREYLLVSDWYSDSWLKETLEKVMLAFEDKCERWRGLYNAALSQREIQNRIIGDASRPASDKEQAKRLRREAESQLELLTRSDPYDYSDFYSYRYFASEGFLPGYNFPRLPLSAYIPARGRRRSDQKDEYISRPRFLAISEFGPRSIIYHEGSRYVINKVIIPVSQENDIMTSEAKLCNQCGYLHPIQDTCGVDLCEMCGASLPAPLRQLFRLQNVSTRRRDRISSDEEDRMRLGYEIQTSIRFAEYGGTVAYKTAKAIKDDESVAELTYSQAATIRRINLGWRRRKNKNRKGFLLDIERGYWAKSEVVQDDTDDGLSNRTMLVVPFVEDRKNSLLINTAAQHTVQQMASLQAALKSAIQILFQLEDNELAAEPLPNRDERSQLLFYEAAEGGAGVLSRLVEDPTSLSQVAREALALCHFNPDTGEDLRRSPKAKEDCEAACYNCLMSYSNQMDHPLLDRHTVRDLLMSLAAGRVEASPTDLPRSEHLVRLKRQCDSDLERQWLDYLDQSNLRLPAKAQQLFEACGTRADFYYPDSHAAIYIDGSHHDYPDRQQRDQQQSQCMEELGIMVIRFGYRDNWDVIIEKYPSIFGRKP